MKKISCIIAALNEEKQIANVLDAVLEAKKTLPLEIIVVDDGSTDMTPLILQRYKDIRVITNQTNMGKSYAVARGLEAAKGDYIMTLDADLIGLSADNIFSLLAPIQNGTAEVTMNIRKNSFMYMRMLKLDAVTGERVFPRSLIAKHIEEIKNLRRFGLEVFLNDLIIKQKYPVKTVYWNTVCHTMKFKKRGIYSGIKADSKMFYDMQKTVPVSGWVRQNIALIKLSVKE